MKLTFNDSQYLDVQDIQKLDNCIHISVINTKYETLKHLFTDPLATIKMTLGNIVYENYTIFSFIRENYGGIFTIEMVQEGKDTKTILSDLMKDSESANQQITGVQMALCEVYEMLLGLEV